MPNMAYLSTEPIYKQAWHFFSSDNGLISTGPLMEAISLSLPYLHLRPIEENT